MIAAATVRSRFPRRRRRRTAALAGLVVLSCAALPFVSGCRDVVEEENARTDNAFLRTPEEPVSDIKLAEGALFPLKPGNHWVMAVQSGETPSVEDQLVVGEKSVGSTSGTVVQISHNGKTDRNEVYRENAQGLELVGAGSIGDVMTITPPIPLVHFPPKDGDQIAWSGVLHYRKTEAPGTALSRVSGRANITTPAGKFTAYRVDTIINTTVQGQAIAFPTTRFFAPGVGIVSMKLLAGTTLVTKQLKSYHVQ